MSMPGFSAPEPLYPSHGYYAAVSGSSDMTSAAWIPAVKFGHAERLVPLNATPVVPIAAGNVQVRVIRANLPNAL